MAIMRLSLWKGTLTIRRWPNFKREEVKGEVPSLALGELRVTWWPRKAPADGRQRKPPGP
jgi:hypothetical protein